MEWRKFKQGKGRWRCASKWGVGGEPGLTDKVPCAQIAGRGAVSHAQTCRRPFPDGT